jgi:hypothetical protein
VLCGLPILADWFKETLGCALGAQGRGHEYQGKTDLWGKLKSKHMHRVHAHQQTFPFEQHSPVADWDRAAGKQVRAYVYVFMYV